MTNADLRRVELLEVNIPLRCFVDACGTCKDRQAFYNTLKSSGPDAAYKALESRPNINVLWLEKVLEIIIQSYK